MVFRFDAASTRPKYPIFAGWIERDPAAHEAICSPAVCHVDPTGPIGMLFNIDRPDRAVGRQERAIARGERLC